MVRIRCVRSSSPRCRRAIGSLTVWTIVALVLLSGCGGKEEAKAPAFSLTDAVGGQVTLYDLLDVYDRITLVFYRGFF